MRRPRPWALGELVVAGRVVGWDVDMCGSRAWGCAQGLLLVFVNGACVSSVTSAKSGTKVEKVEPVSAKGSPVDEFRSRFRPLHDTLHSESARFSGAQMLADLEGLIPLAEAHGRAAVAELFYDLSLLQSKRMESAAVVELGTRALEAHGDSGALEPEQIFYLHYRMSKGAQEMEDLPSALEHLSLALGLLDHAALTTDQVLGLRMDFGFLLHENRDFARALTDNLETLAMARRELGEQHPALLDLLNNVAQNHYELGDLTQAHQFLTERLGIAEDAADFDAAFDSRFQLGVLAHEQGDFATAEEHFSRNLKLAKSREDPYYVDLAETHLAEHRHKKAAAGAP